MGKTNIEWTKKTWNPLAGCTAKSPGCLNCYAAAMSARLEAMGTPKYTGVTITRGSRKVFNGLINYDEKVLLAPLSMKKSDTFFVNSMSDLFWGDDEDLATARRLGVIDPKPVPFEFIDKVFAVMALTPHHTYQILTKRPGRMLEYFNTTSGAVPGDEHPDRKDDVYLQAWTLAGQQINGLMRFSEKEVHDAMARWPLPNVHPGVSVEDQKTAEERIPLLLETPAAVRWLSCEPLLGPIELMQILIGHKLEQVAPKSLRPEDFILPATIDWVVCGGESGANARPMHPAWARSLRDQCTDPHSGPIPFFFKQWGNWYPACEKLPDDAKFSIGAAKALTHIHTWHDEDQNLSFNVGRKNAGRFLDGRTWDEMPEVSR